MIGIVLGVVAILLAAEVKRLLIGEAADTAIVADIRHRIDGDEAAAGT